MTEIETLTEQEHAFVTRQAPNDLYAKLVRIHDQQAERIAGLEGKCGQLIRDLLQHNGGQPTRVTPAIDGGLPRYDLSNDGTMEEEPDGYWCKVEDVRAHIEATEASAATTYAISRQRVAAVEAKETSRNEARLAELASGTVPRTEYDAMVAQRDTLRQERTEAREQRDALRWVLGDVLSDLLEMQKDPEHSWHLEEAIWQLEGATERKGPLSKSPTPMPPPEIMALITEGMQQVMTTLTNIERPGELARIYSALDAIQDHIDDLVEAWQAQTPAEPD